MAKNKTGEFRIGRGLTDHLYVDVDGTLLLWRGNEGAPSVGDVINAWDLVEGKIYNAAFLPRVNTRLVGEINKWMRRRPDGVVVIWSMGGTKHAELARHLCDFEPSRGIVCIAKPDLLIDDAGPSLLAKKIKIADPKSFACPEQ